MSSRLDRWHFLQTGLVAGAALAADGPGRAGLTDTVGAGRG
jgi:hypothetical protein